MSNRNDDIDFEVEFDELCDKYGVNISENTEENKQLLFKAFIEVLEKNGYKVERKS